MTMQIGSLLVLAPHPDDEVIGAGGTIAKVLRAGGRVHVAIGNGYPEARVDEARTAAQVLGGASVSTMMKTPGWLDSLPLGDVVSRIESVIEFCAPDCVLLPDPASAHQEHRVIAHAAMAAMRPSGGTPALRPPVVACYEQAADAWRLTAPAHPTVHVALNRLEMDRKLAAMGAHRSQERLWPSERSGDALEHLARLRGAQAGVDFAESFCLLRWVL
jgi:LmbE family N-acetylglucosaminyl deacetylase